MRQSLVDYGYLLAAFIVAGGAWWFIAPQFVKRTNPRLRHRNPSNYRRLVAFYRTWGIAAVALGILLAIGLGGPEG